MRLRLLLMAGLMMFCLWGVLHAFQVGFKEYPFEETNPAPVPAGANDRTEWAFARLRYPSITMGGRGGPGKSAGPLL